MEKDSKKLKWPILLFDFDGTLVSTEELAQRSILEYFSEKNITILDSFAEKIIGRTWKAAAEILSQDALKLGIVLDQPSKLVQDWKAKYRTFFQGGVEVIPGMIEKLEKVRKNVQFMGIVTGSEADEVEAILKNLGINGLFNQVWAAGDYEHSKPHPAPFLTAMKEIGAQKKDTLAFEDSIPGVESAFQAGIPFVQVLHCAHTRPDSRAFKQIKNWNDFDLNWLKEDSETQ